MPNRPSDPSDPKAGRPRITRYDPRDRDPRYDPRDEPGYDPRNEAGYDPRNEPGYDPRDERRDPRDRGYDARGEQYDPRDARYERRDERYDDRADFRRDRDGRAGGPPPPAPPVEPAPRRRSMGKLLALLAGLAALLLAGLLAYRMTRDRPNEDRLDGNAAGETAAAAPAASGEQRCGSQRTYDLVKRELFRQAAQTRGSDAAAFDRLSAYATLRVASPVLKRQDEQLGTSVCGGNLVLDLPPGVGVVGGRRTLSANADYALQPAADGSGDVVTLSGADNIVTPLTTLARTDSQPGVTPPAQAPQPGSIEPAPGTTAPAFPPAPPPQPSPPVRQPERAAPPPTQPQPRPEPRVSARPSFNCANARTRGEIAVCGSDRLATLDRRMAAEFVGALNSASSEQRALLQRTRGSFLAYRDRCTSEACMAGAYQDRIREIRDIINDRWRPR